MDRENLVTLVRTREEEKVNNIEKASNSANEQALESQITNEDQSEQKNKTK